MFRRRAGQRDHGDLIAPGDIKRLADSVEKAVAEAMDRANEKRLLSEASALNKARKRNSSMAIVSLAISALFFAGGTVCAYLAVVAFQPASLHNAGGEIILAMSGKYNTTKQGNAGVKVRYGTSDTAYAFRGLEIDLYFPTTAIGQEWKLILVNAPIVHPFMLYGSDFGPLSTSLRPCGWDPVNLLVPGTRGGEMEKAQCQVFSGTVEDSKYKSVHPFDCSGTLNQELGTRAQNVDIAGDFNSVAQQNWAYKAASVPIRYHGDNGQGGLAINGVLTGLNFDAIYTIPNYGMDCTNINGPSNYHSVKIAPTSQVSENPSLSETSWNNLSGGSQGDLVAYRRDTADAWQNAGVISAGVSFTIAGGFLPVGIQSLLQGSRRRTSKRHAV